MEVRDIGLDDMDWIQLAQERDYWRAHFHKMLEYS
jgi:hypothetical protein